MKYLQIFEEYYDPTTRIENSGWTKLKRDDINGPGDEVINWYKYHTFVDPLDNMSELVKIGFLDLRNNKTSGTWGRIKKEVVSSIKTGIRRVPFDIWKTDDDWWLIHPYNSMQSSIGKLRISDRDYFLCDGLEGVKNFINSL